MPLFKINNNLLKKIKIKDLDLEKNLQKLFENNLEESLNIVFLAHEYSTSFGGRIDTLGIDKNGSPCIIEYKKNQNDNVINQGLSYLRWLLDHKADFERLVENNLPKSYSDSRITYNGSADGKIKVDWDSPRVICIAENYSRFDLDTADILPINIELLRYRIYEDDLLYIEPENYQKVKIQTSGIIKKSQQTKLEKLQKTYTIDDHLGKADDKTQLLFKVLREKILSIDENIKEEPKKLYIAYKATTNFADVTVLYGSKPQCIKLWLNVKSGQLNDPSLVARDLTKPKPVGHWGNGDYEVKIVETKDIEKILPLIKQSYDLNK